MMSAMVMSVLERTRGIGTLRRWGSFAPACAAHDPAGEAILLASLIGGVFGVALGAFLAWLVGRCRA